MTEIAMWRKRVSMWRVSGETAAVFSARQGFSVYGLRRWSSRLGRETRRPVVRVAQLVRSAAGGPTDQRGSIVVENLDTRVRITIGSDADRETLSAVLSLTCSRSGQ
jgi:hypothetical protein